MRHLLVFIVERLNRQANAVRCLRSPERRSQPHRERVGQNLGSPRVKPTLVRQLIQLSAPQSLKSRAALSVPPPISPSGPYTADCATTCAKGVTPRSEEH